MKIDNYKIDSQSPVFIIAELSANHNGSLENALKSVHAAKEAGADAIKLQTYTADTITLDVKSEIFKINHGTAWDGQYLYDLYLQAYTPWEWHKTIFDEANKIGLTCFSSPFDLTAITLLEELNTPIYKIASFEITDIALIKACAKTGKPIIISTGIATIEDIILAIETCKNVGNENITLLACTSEYPAPPENANLRMVADLAQRFNVKAGLSDHTLGHLAPVIAVSLGAKVIEKHFILDKRLGGPDSHFSLDTNEFKAMVDAIRQTEKMLGTANYDLTDKKKNSRKFARSLFVSADVKENDILNAFNIRSVRPNNGLHPKFYAEVLGKSFKVDCVKGTPLSFDIIKF